MGIDPLLQQQKLRLFFVQLRSDEFFPQFQIVSGCLQQILTYLADLAVIKGNLRPVVTSRQRLNSLLHLVQRLIDPGHHKAGQWNADQERESHAKGDEHADGIGRRIQVSLGNDTDNVPAGNLFIMTAVYVGRLFSIVIILHNGFQVFILQIVGIDQVTAAPPLRLGIYDEVAIIFQDISVTGQCLGNNLGR